ncbi:predicted protein [Naegleria gruberi]|uniref:Predicted protein n=1 Tax=Naegleria gruberi TaxID=5762 RepID=D2W010_NAEGR|nr:uncharacterized protein NAEGRDRAFT_74690 [Naegleria gruberi]EFC37622.1 predicted protein [Naegleria gruberi]|eukprot:XP_002670366.1 predicted protein [Naegleria gruberi strain NEG-M]
MLPAERTDRFNKKEAQKKNGNFLQIQRNELRMEELRKQIEELKIENSLLYEQSIELANTQETLKNTNDEYKRENSKLEQENIEQKSDLAKIKGLTKFLPPEFTATDGFEVSQQVTTTNVKNENRSRLWCFSLLQFITLMICAATLTLYWINASRLYTEPNIIKMVTAEFECPANNSTVNSTTTDIISFYSTTNSTSNDSTTEPITKRTEVATIESVTGWIMVLDFFRTYLMILIIPSSIIWYTYYTEDYETKELKHKSNKCNFTCQAFICSLAFVLLLGCLIFFGYAENTLSWQCPTVSNPLVIYLSMGMFLCSLLSIILYFIQTCCHSRLFKEKPIRDGTFKTGLLVIRNINKLHGITKKK